MFELVTCLFLDNKQNQIKKNQPVNEKKERKKEMFPTNISPLKRNFCINLINNHKTGLYYDYEPYLLFDDFDFNKIINFKPIDNAIIANCNFHLGLINEQKYNKVCKRLHTQKKVLITFELYMSMWIAKNLVKNMGTKTEEYWIKKQLTFDKCEDCITNYIMKYCIINYV